jgi:glycosyltransferase involved in cell wall biosynthesis
VTDQVDSPTERPLKVAHALGWYFPDSTGGTEVYVESLARHLIEFGVASQIAAPARQGDRGDSRYTWNGMPVYRYPVPASTPEELAHRLPPGHFPEFDRWLAAQDCDVYHQHTLMCGCELAQLRSARALGLRTVVTIHVPGDVCLRGTMLLDGVRPCDGRVDVERCTSCWGPSRGIPSIMARWEAGHPSISTKLARWLPDTPLRTALLTPAAVVRRQQELLEIHTLADRVIAVCRWLYDALLRNGFPAEKLVYCPQGIDLARPLPPGPEPSPTPPGLRIGFLGRWERVKGIHVLVRAFRRMPRDVGAELIVHGVPADRRYEREVRALAEGDERIHIRPPVPRAEIMQTLAGFDFLAVPSLWMETGPLVVLEAFAAGVPVIGSNLGGIAELVEPGVNGVLVPPGDTDAWQRTLTTLGDATRARSFWRIPPPRSGRQVAADVARVYYELVAGEAQSRSRAS